MENELHLKDLQVSYKFPSNTCWYGRTTDVGLGNQYWYQSIKLNNRGANFYDFDFALIGYACDEGVLRNKGRIGAKNAPDIIRNQLGKIALHHSKNVIDLGSIECAENNLEASQKAFSKAITFCINKNIIPIGIGGGHDIAFANFMGTWNAIKEINKNKIGIINFDAHFDLRPVKDTPNSGTPFFQIINELKKINNNVDYLAIGIQKPSNTKELFDIANKEMVSYALNEDCFFNEEKVVDHINKIIANNDYIYLTIDMDGFSSAFAPGVSAPSSVGLDPKFVFKMLAIILNSKKVISLDIAEVNPVYDIDNKTSKLAAKLIDYIVSKI